MKQRCYNPNNPNYLNYGGKGISICDEWVESYEEFSNWAKQNGYKEGLTIDRINSDNGYSPKNCRWITLSENSSRANIGRHKNKSKLTYMYAISPHKEIITINNIKQFSDTNNLNYSSVVACLHNRIKTNYNDWEFHSNLTDK